LAPTSHISLSAHNSGTVATNCTMDELMEGFVNGAKQFWQWISNPFEVCCCPGHRADDEDDNGKGGVEEGYIDLWHKDNNGGTTCVTTPAEGRVVIHGGMKNKDKTTG
ncbi:unnamed protein product, partial [Ectocarpus fasciculatus]